MPIYEYQGKSYDIASDDPAEAKNKILKFLSTGEGESKPKSAQQAPVEGAGGAAFGVYRPQGRRPESQQDREASKDMALQTVRGAVSNVMAPLGLPVDIANAVYNLPRTAENISNRIQSVRSQLAGNEQQPLPELPPEQKIPGIGEYGMNFYNQLVPGPVPTSPQGQLAFAGGQAIGAPIANKAISGAIAAPRVIKQAGQQIGRGAMEGVTNSTYKPGPNTAFAEVGDTFYPNKDVVPFMKLTPEQQVQALPALEASQQPSSSLFTGFLNKAAQRLAPEGPQGGTLVPLEGRGVQAFTEQNVRDFFNKPSLTNLSGATGNIGGAVLGGLVGGFPGALAGALAPQYIKALELLAQRRLQGTAGLKPGFAQQLGQAQATAGRLGLESAIPETPPLLGYTPRQGGGGAAGPVNPTLYVGPTGEATTNLAGTQVNMNPGSMAVPTPAANAAMATTQAKTTGPAVPRAPAQPKAEWTMPTAEETWNTARSARPSFQEYEAFDDAVKQRTQDILKQARREGRNLSQQAAENQADAEIRAVRFPKKSETTGPTLAQQGETPALVKTPGEGTLDKPNVAWDRQTWFELQQKVASGKPLTAGDQSKANIITNRYGPDPFGSGDIAGKKLFNTQAQGETAAKVVETPAAPTITPEQQAKRDNFINNTVKEHLEQMKKTRASNKELYADEAETMREMAEDQKFRKGPPTSFTRSGIPSEFQPNPKDVFTERKAVADMVGKISNGNVTSKNKNIIVRRSGYDAMADDIGIKLDWDTAPRVDGLTVKESRKVMDKWMMDTINKELPELGLYKRQESLRSQSKRAEAEFKEEVLTPEQQADINRRLEQFNNPNSPLNKVLSGKTSLEKPPKTEAPKTETPKVETPPEKTAAEKSAEAQRILEIIRSRSKNKPSGTMEMKVADADGITRYGSETKPVSIDDARIAAYEHSIKQTPSSIWTEVDGVKYNFRDNGAWGKSVFKVNKDGTAVEYYGNKTEGYKRKEYDKAGNMKGMPKTSPDQFPDFPGDILL